jgi:hypothetical protein
MTLLLEISGTASMWSLFQSQDYIGRIYLTWMSDLLYEASTTALNQTSEKHVSQSITVRKASDLPRYEPQLSPESGRRSSFLSFFLARVPAQDCD